MSLIRAHLPCDDCGSRDALAEYEKNTYCFSCGVSKKKGNVKHFFARDTKPKVMGKVVLPKNTGQTMPSEAQKLLLKGGITDDIALEYGIFHVANATLWTTQNKPIYVKNRLIFPCYSDNKDLVWYQARAVDKADQPKYYTVGNKDYLFKAGEDGDTVVITEDMLSAIKVGHHTRAISLQGTSINKQNLVDISQKYTNIIVWLDGDKPGLDAARKIIKQFQLVASNVQQIITGRDPKCLTNGQIDEKIAKALSLRE